MRADNAKNSIQSGRRPCIDVDVDVDVIVDVVVDCWLYIFPMS